MLPLLAMLVGAIFCCAMGAVVLISIGRAASLPDYSLPRHDVSRR